MSSISLKDSDVAAQGGRWMPRGKVWVLSALFLVGVYVAYTGVVSVGLTKAQGGLSAGLLPTVAGAGLSLTCLLVFLKPADTPTDAVPPAVGYLRVKRWLVFAVLVGAVALVDMVGFTLAMSLATYGLMAWVERAGQLEGLLLGAIVGVTVWLVFDVLLGVPLPEGALWPT